MAVQDIGTCNQSGQEVLQHLQTPEHQIKDGLIAQHLNLIQSQRDRADLARQEWQSAHLCLSRLGGVPPWDCQ